MAEGFWEFFFQKWVLEIDLVYQFDIIEHPRISLHSINGLQIANRLWKGVANAGKFKPINAISSNGIRIRLQLLSSSLLLINNARTQTH